MNEGNVHDVPVVKARKKKANRRGQGEGSVFQRSTDKRWVAMLDLGRDENGKRVRKAFYAATMQEAIAKRDEGKTLIATGRPLPDLQQTMGAWLTYWTTEVLPGTVRPSTADGHVWMIDKYIRPYLRDVKVGKLSATQVNSWLRKLEHAQDGHKALSVATRRKARGILSRAMADAVRMGKASHNPVALIKAPSQPGHRTDDALSIEEAKRLLAAAKGHRLEALVTVAVAVGLRRGEALALKWDAVDLDAGSLVVRATLKRRKEVGLVLDEPKTEAGRRTVPLPQVCIAALRAQRIRQATEKLAAGPRWQEGGFVFTTPIGTPIDPRNMSTNYHRLTVAAGLGKRRFHALRHSAASLMLAQGVPLEIVSRTLGHAGLAITIDVYGHLGQEVLRRGADAMDGALGG